MEKYFIIIMLKNGQIIRIREEEEIAKITMAGLEGCMDDNLPLKILDENGLMHYIPYESIALLSMGKVIEQEDVKNNGE